MQMGTARTDLNQELFQLPNSPAAATYTYTLDTVECPTEVARLALNIGVTLAVNGTNYIAVTVQKVDAVAAATRVIATMTTFTGGAAITAGTTTLLSIVTTEDAVNYTVPRRYAQLSEGDKLQVVVVVTGAPVVTGLTLRLGTMQNAQTGS